MAEFERPNRATRRVLAIVVLEAHRELTDPMTAVLADQRVRTVRRAVAGVREMDERITHDQMRAIRVVDRGVVERAAEQLVELELDPARAFRVKRMLELLALFGGATIRARGEHERAMRAEIHSEGTARLERDIGP